MIDAKTAIEEIRKGKLVILVDDENRENEGDMVVAEKKSQAKDGDIVIALVDGGWTMKYYRTRQGKTYLEPANKDFKNIYPEYQLEIAAIVKGVIRKY